MTIDFQPAEVEDEQTFLIRKEIIQASQAEHALVRCVLLDNSLYASAGVSYNLFQSASLRKIYSATGEMIGDRRPADVVTVAEHLQAKEPHIDWLAVLVDVVRNSWGEPDQIEEYCSILKESYAKRTARDIANRLLEGITKDIGAVDIAVRDLMQLGQSEQRYEHDMGETLRATVAHIEEAYDRAQGGGTVGIPTGLIDLDEAIGGWHPSDLYVVAARPSVGKTAALINMLINSMSPFGMLSSEQAYIQVGMRMISMQGMVSGNKMRRGKLKDDEWLKIQAAINILRQRTFWINDQASMDINDITRQARKWKYTNDVQLIGVDYIQRLKGTNPRMPPREKVMEITTGLKSLAKELDIPVIALAQVNRDCEKRPDKRPQMGDIMESAIVEQEADGVCCLYRDEVYDPDTADKGVLEWLWHKNRHGPTGIVRTQWQGEFFKVNNFASQYYQGGY